ncbi:MAG: SDR family oxidoreductase [Clostridia bacterium]|nr:SDR family oxidoreductase [Clostridia bacterium]
MKTALITGASGAIGLEMVKIFARNGYFITAQYNKKGENLFNLIEELKKENIENQIMPVKADFSVSQSIENLYFEHIKTYSHVDVLINNAGVDFYAQVQDLKECDYQRVFDINVKAPMLLTSLCAKNMVERKSGKIIFISSIWGVNGGSYESLYSASKSSLIAYSKALAKELGPSNINVNCICPGVIKSPMNDGYTEEEIQDLIDRTPLGKIGSPSDVGELALFLSSEKSNFITGQSIVIDGGFIL